MRCRAKHVFCTLNLSLHCEISGIKWAWEIKLKGHLKSYTHEVFTQCEFSHGKHTENIVSRFLDICEIFKTSLPCDVSNVGVWSDHWGIFQSCNSEFTLWPLLCWVSGVSWREFSFICCMEGSSSLWDMHFCRAAFFFSTSTMEVLEVKLLLGRLHPWQLPPQWSQRSPAGMYLQQKGFLYPSHLEGLDPMSSLRGTRRLEVCPNDLLYHTHTGFSLLWNCSCWTNLFWGMKIVQHLSRVRGLSHLVFLDGFITADKYRAGQEVLLELLWHVELHLSTIEGWPFPLLKDVLLFYSKPSNCLLHIRHLIWSLSSGFSWLYN